MAVTTSNLAALLPAKATPLVVEERPSPTPKEDQIVIRNHAIAINPVDWKRQASGFGIDSYPTILGSDIAGVVTAVGSSVTNFKSGDRVLGYTGAIIGGSLDSGAFQTYSVTRALTAAKLPDSLSFEEAAIIPLGLVTAAAGLFNSLGLHLPKSDSPESQSSILLIWGGSSSVGSNAIQLAVRLGYTVFTTASATHHDYLKSLGAAEVFDYHLPTVVDDIVAAAKKADKPIKSVLDAVALASSIEASVGVLENAGNEGGKLAITLGWPETLPKPDNIKVIAVAARSILTETHVATWLFDKFLTKSLEKGTFVPSPKLELLEGGLDGLQHGLDLLKKGASGQKFAVKLD